MSCHIISYHVMSYHIISYHIISENSDEKKKAVECLHVARVLLDLAGRDDLLSAILVLLGEIGERE